MLHIQKPCHVKSQRVRLIFYAYRGFEIPAILTWSPDGPPGDYEIDLDYFQEFSYDFTNDNGVTHRKMLGPCFAKGPTNLVSDVTYTISDPFHLQGHRLSDGRKEIAGCTTSQKGRAHFGGLYVGYDHVEVNIAYGKVSAVAWEYDRDGVVWGPRDNDFTIVEVTATPLSDDRYLTTTSRTYIDKAGNRRPPSISSRVYRSDVISYGYTDYDLSDVASEIRSQVRLNAPRRNHSEDDKYFACKDAISHLDVIGINVYETLQPLKDGWRSIPKAYKQAFKELRGFIESGGKNIKSFCNSYLFKKYGIDNDLRDLKGLDGFKTLELYLTTLVLHQHGAYNGIRATVHCSPFTEGINWTDVLGITPNASNLWAVVPFSFAVDWFLKGGDNLREIELAAMWSDNCYHIHSVCYSTKVEYQSAVSLPGFSFNSELSFSLYDRWAERYAPDFVYEVPDYFAGLENHFIEFGSLVVTNL